MLEVLDINPTDDLDFFVTIREGVKLCVAQVTYQSNGTYEVKTLMDNNTHVFFDLRDVIAKLRVAYPDIDYAVKGTYNFNEGS